LIQSNLDELGYEQTLAANAALVKGVLALVSCIFVFLIHPFPQPLGSNEISEIALFVVYLWAVWLAVRLGWATQSMHQWMFPVLDATAVTMLVVATGGTASPLRFWFAVAIVSSSIMCSLPSLCLCLAASLAGLWLSTFFDSSNSQMPTFGLVGVQLIGLAALGALARIAFRNQVEAFLQINRFSNDVESANELEDAVNQFESACTRLLKADKARLDLKAKIAFGPNEVILVGKEGIWGVCEIYRERPPSADEKRLLKMLADRFHSANRRLTLAQELVKSTARDERQRYADELHDTHLQTLAAVDMQVELAVQKSKDAAIVGELKEIKQAVREAAQKTRAFIGSLEDHPPLGPDSIRELVQDRWPGAVVHIQEHVELSEGQWTAIRMLCQEGINNAKTHGRSRQIWLTLVQYGPEAVVRLEADGRDPVEGARHGYGLRRLETIVNANHGELALEKGSTGGSCLRASFMRVGTT
jgi:signal transduction histidine kinase